MGLPDAVSFLIPVAEAKVVLVFLELYPAPTLFMATGLILEFNLLIAFKYSIARILFGSFKDYPIHQIVKYYFLNNNL